MQGTPGQERGGVKTLGPFPKVWRRRGRWAEDGSMMSGGEEKGTQWEAWGGRGAPVPTGESGY